MKKTQGTPYAIVKKHATNKPSSAIIAELLRKFPNKDQKKLKSEGYSLIYRFKKKAPAQKKHSTPKPVTHRETPVKQDITPEEEVRIDSTVDKVLAALAVSPKLDVRPFSGPSGYQEEEQQAQASA